MIQIVTKPKLRAVELLSGTKKEASRLQEFYDLIANGQLKSDEEAAKVLYNEDKQAPVYKKLRKNLKDRLVSALFVIDLNQSSYTDRQKAYYECYKEWAAVKILFGKNARNAAVRMALKIYKVSRHYEFTELNVDICHPYAFTMVPSKGIMRAFRNIPRSCAISKHSGWRKTNRKIITWS